jgi:hypothetical protein
MWSTPKKMKNKAIGKKDQAVRSEGAEAYVRAILMMEFGVITSMASRNMPGHDLVAHNLENGRRCKISVKYRRAENADGFRYVGERHDYDFLVAVVGRRGRIGDHNVKVDPKEGFKAEVFVFPKSVAINFCETRKTYDILPNPLRKRCGKHLRKYKGAWHLITRKLGYTINRVMREEEMVVKDA